MLEKKDQDTLNCLRQYNGFLFISSKELIDLTLSHQVFALNSNRKFSIIKFKFFPLSHIHTHTQKNRIK